MKIANTWYVQAGKHAEYLAKVIAKIDTKENRVIDIQSQLLPAVNYPVDTVSSQVIQSWAEKARTFSAKPICYVDKEISSSGIPGYDCHMSEIICRAISWATKVPVVFHGILSNSWWHKGSYLTEARLFDTVPYENGIGKAKLTLEELKEIILEQLDYKGSKSFNGVYGLRVEVKGNDSSIEKITLSKKLSLGRDKRIPVAFNSYVIAGAGGRFPKLRDILRRPTSQLVDLEVNSREILREYLRNSDEWKPPPIHWFKFRK